MAVEHRTALKCDLCPHQITWQLPLSQTAARQAAKQKYGWRTDKLNRDVCGRHPKLNQRKSREK